MEKTQTQMENCDSISVVIPFHIEALPNEESKSISRVSMLTGYSEDAIEEWIDAGLLTSYKLGLRSDKESNNENIRVYPAELKGLYRRGRIKPKDPAKINNTVPSSDIPIPDHIELLPDEKPLCIVEVSKLTGFSQACILRWVKLGLLPAYKLGLRSASNKNNNESIRMYAWDLKNVYRRTRVVPKHYRKSNNVPTGEFKSQSARFLNIKLPVHIETLDDANPFSIRQISALAGFSRDAIRDWIDAGLLVGYKLGLRSDNEKDRNESIRVYGCDLKNLYRRAVLLSRRYKKLKEAAASV